MESGLNNSDYANCCKVNHIAEPKNALEASEIFTLRFSESPNIVEHVVDALFELGEMVEQDTDLVSQDKEDIATLMEGIKTGNLSAATFAKT